ncbi:MAG: hypothetical protein MUF51_06415 [Vicinamibacteria bacterium]|jgi:hypothetical protein|nr:hypothetical protein [Vicinamibacteria bacterium]
MGVRTPEDEPFAEPAEAPAPSDYALSWRQALALALLLFGLLNLNGRAIDAGDTRANTRVAASLAESGRFDLDDHPEVEPPFARLVNGRRVSIYPALSPFLATPIFWIARRCFVLDELGAAMAGKLTATLFAALAAACLARAISRRHGAGLSALSGAAFALTTSLCSTSQALWQHPLACLCFTVAILFVQDASRDERWAYRAALPLSLMVAARQADIALVAVIMIALAWRFPRLVPRLALWASPAIVATALYQWKYFGAPWRHGFTDAWARFSVPNIEGHLGVLISPAKGLLLFTPIVLLAVYALGRRLTEPDRFLPMALGGGALAHWLFMGCWLDWHGGECFGPRMMTDTLPGLFLYLADGLLLWPRLGAALAVFSFTIQSLGMWSYLDYRWERLHQRPSNPAHPELWRLADSPIPFLLREGVVRITIPTIEAGRLRERETHFVLGGDQGSRVSFLANALNVAGQEKIVTDVRLMRAARIEERSLRLRGNWSGIAWRMLGSTRARPLEIRVEGQGQGPLYIGEGSFWSTTMRYKEYSMQGRFTIRHLYFYPESGGDEIEVNVGRGDGAGLIESVTISSRTP